MYPLAQTQVHGFTESRPVIYETNLKSFTANPEAVLEKITEEKLAITANDSKDFVKMQPFILTLISRALNGE